MRTSDTDTHCAPKASALRATNQRKVIDMGFFDKLKAGLKKTREGFKNKLNALLAGFGRVDEDLFDELEELLKSLNDETFDILKGIQVTVL